jgi:hypothetical protein
MKIFTIWGQRTYSYPGEYAPELLASADEWTEEDNPGYLKGEQEKAEKMVESREMSFIKRIVFDFNADAFTEAFNPAIPEIAAEIIKE